MSVRGRDLFKVSIGLWLGFTTTIDAHEGHARPDDHAPIGVMADHYHRAGQFMFSYRYMGMEMRNNAIGSKRVDTDTIVTTVPNRFFGAPGQPATLRVAPTSMSVDMQMLGLMYAPTDKVTLLAMTSLVDKAMSHVTYAGGTGTSVLGSFRTASSGLGDTSVSALIRLRESNRNRVHLNAGVSIPTGATDETGTILAPNGTVPTVRLPYAMQLGSGSYDFLTGLTWTSFLSVRSSLGVQWRAVIRTSDNDEGYRLGDEHRLTAWFSRIIIDRLSWSARLEWFDRRNIKGLDSLIVAPVQTADPSRYGATRTTFALGLNLAMVGGHRVAVEYSTPISQSLDGPQLRSDRLVTLGYQFSF